MKTNIFVTFLINKHTECIPQTEDVFSCMIQKHDHIITKSTAIRGNNSYFVKILYKRKNYIENSIL